MAARLIGAVLLLLASLVGGVAQGLGPVGVNLVNPQVRPSLEGDEVAAIIDDFSKWTCSEWGHQVPCTNHISLTRTTSAYVWGADGIQTLIPSGQPAFSNKGVFVGLGNTNLALQSRDFTQGVWVATTVTTAKTATGADGVANSASILTSTSGSSTAHIIQSITGSSVARILSFYVQCITCTGNINIAQDGATWTTLNSSSCVDQNNVASNLVTTQYVLCTLTATQLNPIIGFQFQNSGDSINVDFAGLQTGSQFNPTIPAAGSSAFKNNDNYAISGLLQTIWGAAPAFSVIQTGLNAGNGTGYLLAANGSTSNIMAKINNNTQQHCTAAGTSINATLGSGGWFLGPVKAGTSWAAASSLSCVANNGTSLNTANTLAVSTTMSLGSLSAGTQAFNGYIIRLAANAFQPADTYLKAMTIP